MLLSLVYRKPPEGYYQIILDYFSPDCSYIAIYFQIMTISSNDSPYWNEAGLNFFDFLFSFELSPPRLRVRNLILSKLTLLNEDRKSVV